MSEMRDWGNRFVAELDISPAKVLEIGCAPLEWGGAEIDCIDQKGGRGVTMHGRLEDYETDKRYDLVSMIWALAYCLQPDKAVQRAVDLLDEDGHLLIISRVFGHLFQSRPGTEGGCVWIPTDGWLERMDRLYPLQLIKKDEYPALGAWAGLWRKIA